MLRLRVLSGSLRPGARVRESVLATELGLSRAPVREALRKLEQAGLLAKEPNHSHRVTQFDERDLEELASLRRSLEVLAAEFVPMTDEVVDLLCVRVEEMRTAELAGDRVAAAAADRAFHEQLVESSGHGRLQVAYRSMRDQIELALLGVNPLGPKFAQVTARHEDLTDLLRAGDRTKFIRALAAHIEIGMNPESDLESPTIDG